MTRNVGSDARHRQPIEGEPAAAGVARSARGKGVCSTWLEPTPRVLGVLVAGGGTSSALAQPQ